MGCERSGVAAPQDLWLTSSMSRLAGSVAALAMYELTRLRAHFQKGWCAQVTTGNLERVRKVKTRHQRLWTRVVTVREELQVCCRPPERQP